MRWGHSGEAVPQTERKVCSRLMGPTRTRPCCSYSYADDIQIYVSFNASIHFDKKKTINDMSHCMLSRTKAVDVVASSQAKRRQDTSDTLRYEAQHE